MVVQCIWVVFYVWAQLTWICWIGFWPAKPSDSNISSTYITLSPSWFANVCSCTYICVLVFSIEHVVLGLPTLLWGQVASTKPNATLNAAPVHLSRSEKHGKTWKNMEKSSKLSENRWNMNSTAGAWRVFYHGHLEARHRERGHPAESSRWTSRPKTDEVDATPTLEFAGSRRAKYNALFEHCLTVFFQRSNTKERRNPLLQMHRSEHIFFIFLHSIFFQVDSFP